MVMEMSEDSVPDSLVDYSDPGPNENSQPGTSTPVLVRRPCGRSTSALSSSSYFKTSRGGASKLRGGASTSRGGANTSRGGASTSSGSASTSRGGASTSRGGASTSSGGANTSRGRSRSPLSATVVDRTIVQLGEHLRNRKSKDPDLAFYDYLCAEMQIMHEDDKKKLKSTILKFVAELYQ